MSRRSKKKLAGVMPGEVSLTKSLELMYGTSDERPDRPIRKLARLKAAPALLPSAIEEVLRFRWRKK